MHEKSGLRVTGFKGKVSYAQAIGIVSSLAIHACLLAALLLIPGPKPAPMEEIVQISLGHHDSSPLAGSREKAEPAKRKPASARKKSGPAAIAANPVAAQGGSAAATAGEKSARSSVADSGAANTGKADAGLETAESTGVSAGHSILNTGLEIGFGMTGAPAFIRQVKPAYPPLARRLGKEGRVVLRLLIDQYGRLRDIEVIEAAGFGFLEAAVAAARQSTYAPARRNGVTVAAKAILPVRFHLE